MDAGLGMYNCISLISGYWAVCLWRSTERVRNVSPSRLTSVLATVLCLVLGVGFCCWLVFSCFGASCLVVFLSSLVHHTLRHTQVMMSQVIVNGHLTFFWDAVPLVLLF